MISPGKKIDQYEFREKIGAGGMGDVYRATDTTLRRDVAIKLLPEAFARDADRVARFKREAQLLAALNHSNIATIYGLHNDGQQYFLVMELVEGETLAEMIQQCRDRKGAGVEFGVRGEENKNQPPLADARGTVTSGTSRGLSIDEALNIATQICEALEHAHEHGVIHRDLKPANVKVTPEGKAKVLDFGLAKAFSADGTSGEASPISDHYDSQSPTLTASPTIPGVILGTAAYMSPEQARAKPVDRRTDIWALGCIMFEMVTGRQAFVGGTVADILGAVLHKDVDWTSLPDQTPAFLRGILRRCLQKDKEERVRSAADIALQIKDARSASGTQPAMPAAFEAKPITKGWRRSAAFAATAVALLTIGAIARWALEPAAPPPPVSRVAITLPPGQQLARLDQPALAISPDGKNIVYVASQSRDREGAVSSESSTSAEPLPLGRGSDAGPQMLYLRPLDSDESGAIAGTEGAVAPFFSPDGKWIGFFANGKLKKVPVGGGAAVVLANAASPGGASWGTQGTLVLQGTNSSAIGLQQVAQDGGAVQSHSRMGFAGNNHRWPELLPDGQGSIFASSPASVAWNNAQVIFQPAAGAEAKILIQGSQPRYAASGRTEGHLLYTQGGALLAAPFDARRQALTGPSIPVVQGLMQSISNGSAQYAVSRTGTLVYLAGGVSGSQNRMVWVSRTGAEELLPAGPRAYNFPRISPEGRRVAISISDQEVHLWVYDLVRDTLTRLTFEGNTNNTTAWSPDGRRIAFNSNRADTTKPQNLYWQAADGSSGAERLRTSDYQESASSFSPDGKLFAFVLTTPETGRDIWVMNLDDAGKAGEARKGQPFLKSPAEETAASFSPDGKWLAYSSDESGRREIYVQPYPGPGGKWLISTEGGQEPMWNPKGGELFYRSGSKLMAVEINTRSGFEAGRPHMLFDGPYMPTSASLPWYDVSPDGQRFLMLKPIESQASAPTQINVVLNWFEELKQKVPVQ